MTKQVKHKLIRRCQLFWWWLFFIPIYNYGQIEVDSLLLDFPKDSIFGIEYEDIRLLGKYNGRENKLRWAPTNPATWLAGISRGYMVERITYPNTDEIRDVEAFPKDQYFSKAMDSVGMRNLFMEDTSNRFLGMAYGCMYTNWQITQGYMDDPNWLEASDHLSNRWIFALVAADVDSTVARISGLALSDRNIQSGYTYVYNVFIPIGVTGEQFDTASVLVNSSIIQEIPVPEINYTYEDENAIHLSLERATYEAVFSSYYFEVSSDGIDFIQLNRLPFMHVEAEESPVEEVLYITYTDSVINYQPHFYRVRGITPYGEISVPSLSHRLMGRDRTPPPAPTGVEAIFAEPNQMKINWVYEPDNTDLAGFKVKKTFGADQEVFELHKDLLDPHARLFVDSNYFKLQPAFYFIEACDTAGNCRPSLWAMGEVIDTIPPAPPLGLLGDIDTNGVVRLFWQRSPESDVIGYHVYFANDSSHEFANISDHPLQDTAFIDTISLKSLTKHVYYKVTAVDFRYNRSLYSNFLEIDRPDTIPPSSPIFNDYAVEKGSIFLSWAPSSSNDLAYHLLQRQKNDEDWTTLKDFKQAETTYLDTAITPHEYYAYMIKAVDQSGLISESKDTLQVETISFDLRNGVSGLTARVLDDHILLEWQIDTDDVSFFLLYRSEDHGPPLSFKKIVATIRSFEDRMVESGKTYGYFLKVMFKDGEESTFSEELLIEM